MSQISYQSFSTPRARQGHDRQSASNLVLKDPKLLSRILSFLGLQTLICSGQRISKTWREVIATTPSLQEALFFKSPPSGAPRLLNPLLAELWPLWFRSPSSFNKRRPRPKASDFRSLKWLQSPSAFRRRNASWRKMLVISGGTQITALKVTLFTQSWLGSEESHGVFSCPDGLRMGALWDLTKDWCMFDEEATFMLNWDEDLFSGGRGRVQCNSKSVENGGWKSKIRKIFPGRESKKGFADMSLKSTSSSNGRSDYAFSDDGTLNGSEERFVELILSYSVDTQDPEFIGHPVLGQEFQSEGYEKVSISYEKSIPISDL